ncbi:MAG: leucine--tRNA ligase [Eubacteriales bacterium]|nr:leucine--tRNA ligase [Eubacteriales bacterium]
MRYSRAIDHKWQKRWEDENLAAFDWNRVDKKLYVLEMFSYPSGANLHIGHWYNYGLADSWARMKKLQGYEVFQPMGFDAFGLPAENYAIKTGTHPQDSTRQNIETMEKQLKAMGALFNWEHELATCEAEYYRWNQWLFLKLLEHNLAYRKKAPVNWCPSCNTVLANEQVVDDGECERCGSPVERKQLTQWFFRITDYAEELLNHLPELDWPEKTKKIQENWIGRSTGALVDFGLEKDGQSILDADQEALKLSVFTTRVDTLYGVTYVVVAPEAEITERLITPEQRAEVDAYREYCKHLSEIERQSLTREKTGVFTGSYAIHPLSSERIPIWTSDYVIASYGTGAVMAVPAHDERDFEFAKKFNLELKEVIAPSEEAAGAELEAAFTEDGVLVNSAEFTGLKSAEARTQIAKKLSELARGEEKVMYRLRDWLVSRQRYWGTPIPVIYCEQCGMVPVAEKDLPVELPYDVTFTPDGESPLKKCKEFINCECPRCGGPAERDPDTLDTFVCSSWYQFRYVDNHNTELPFDREKVNQLCPVDRYVGGAEHAAMHLLYARFITKALRDMGYLDFDEPFKALTHQGTILGADGQKMSKSKGNTVNPDGYIEKYGSDVFRLYLAFGFAYIEGGPWSDEGLKAVDRFLKRVQRMVNRLAGIKEASDEQDEAVVGGRNPAKALSDKEIQSFNKELEYRLHYTIKEVSRDAERFQFNTSIARLMELVNYLYKYEESVGHSPEFKAAVETMLQLLSPFAPHFAEEAWAELGHKKIIFRSEWPEFDPAKTVRDELEIAIQINGKVVSRMMVSASATAAEVEDLVKAEAAYPEWLAGRELIRFIYVPKRLANLVVKG